MKTSLFEGESFLRKEAAGFGFLGRLFRKGEEAVHASPKGKFVMHPEEEGLSHDNFHAFNPEEIHHHRKEESNEQGIGLVGNGLLGLADLVTPKSWGVKEKAQNGIFKMKEGLDQFDRKVGAKLGGNDIQSFRGKLFSTPTHTHVGEVTNPDGGKSSLVKGLGTDRKPSLLAPIQNTTKAATPLLASMYLGEKLFPQEQNELPPGAMSEQHLASEDHEDLVALALEKQAAFDKIALLEEELEKKAGLIRDLTEERDLLVKEASEERIAKEKAQEEIVLVKQASLEKRAEYEELRLRTIAKERSKHAVELAETLLEKGFVKQAQLESYIDKLMDCDEDTFRLYHSLAKNATETKEGLETLSILLDDKSSKLGDSQSSPLGVISKRGESIGEAARALRKH